MGSWGAQKAGGVRDQQAACWEWGVEVVLFDQQWSGVDMELSRAEGVEPTSLKPGDNQKCHRLTEGGQRPTHTVPWGEMWSRGWLVGNDGPAFLNTQTDIRTPNEAN